MDNMDEEIRQEIKELDPVTIEQELIQDGLNSNYRPIIQVYDTGTHLITETIYYRFKVNHREWAAELGRGYLKEVKNG